MAGLLGNYLPQSQDGGGILGNAQGYSTGDKIGLIGSLLQDAYAGYRGQPGGNVERSIAQADNRNITSRLMSDLQSPDPQTRQRAYMFAQMNGIDTKPFQQQQATQQLPQLLQSMKPSQQTFPSQSAPLNDGSQITTAPINFEAPGLNIQDAIGQAGPELQAQYAPQLMAEAMKGPKYQEVGGGLYQLPQLGQEGGPTQVIAAPRKAPQTRTYRQGTQDITEEFQQDGSWKRLGTGAAFKPESAGEAEISSLSDPAMVNAAVKYNQTGTLPPLGMGKSATHLRTQILDLSAKLASGKYTPEQLVSNIASYKANAGSLNQQIKVFNAIETSGNAAKNSANLALEAARSGGAGPTGIPAFNSWIQAGRKATGDKNVMNLDNHLSTFAEEYAKVMTASTGSAAATDSARSEAHKRLSSANSLDQLEFLIKEMEREMGGRHYAARAQIDGTRKQLGGSPYSEPDGVLTKPKLPPSTQSLPRVKSQPTVSNW